MRFLRQSNQERITLSASPLGTGGEARIFTVVPGERFCAKIYHEPTSAQARKLAAMLANPPEDPMRDDGHISIAWPLDILRTQYHGQTFAGFLMPRVTGLRPLFSVYNPVVRRQELPLFTYQYLHRAGRNLAASLRALHSRDYVIGDVNESNILVSDTALITLVDTDSFQVRAPKTDHVYRCPVGKPDFTPPELQGKNFRLVDRRPEHDAFGLAVLLFLLLMEGTHPFSGVYQDDGDPPPHDARIRAGHFTYGAKRVPYRPMPFAPPYEIVHPALRALFARCFEEGHTDPTARPTAAMWQSALAEAEEALQTCAINTLHRYGEHLTACPWCARTEQLGGRDPFPPQPETPYVRPARRVKPRPIPAVPGTTLVTTGGTTVVRTRIAPPVAVAASTALTQGALPAASSLPSWPLAPTASSLSPTPQAPPITRTLHLPPVFGTYDIRTWLAACLVILTVMLPVFQWETGLGALILGLLGFRATRAGRWLALISAGIGALMMALILGSSLRRTVSNPFLVSVTEQGAIRAVAFARDGRTLATATERNEDQRLISGEVALWNAQTGALTHTQLATGDVTALAYSPDGTLLAEGTGALMEAATVRLRDARTLNMEHELERFQGDVSSLAFSPDSRLLATGCRDKNVTLWDVRTGVPLKQFEAPGEIFAVAFSPDGRYVATGSGTGSGMGDVGRVTVWEIATGKPLWTRHAHGLYVLSLAYTPDGKNLASAGYDSTARCWDARSGKLRHTLEAPGVRLAGAVAFSPDGKTLASGGDDGSARLWDWRRNQLLRTLTGPHAPDEPERALQSLAFSPDGNKLAGGGRDGVANIWRLR